MATLRLTDRDVDALARTAMSEVGHFGKYGEDTLKCGVKAVVDTIINRVVHPGFPNTVEGVVDQKWQFSAIGAPPHGSGTWARLRPATPAVGAIVESHLAARASGAPSTVEGAAHFLNPYLSSQNALRQWGDHVVTHANRVCGRGKDIHYHGYAPGAKAPPPYTLAYRGQSADFSGSGVARAREAVALESVVPFEEVQVEGVGAYEAEPIIGYEPAEAAWAEAAPTPAYTGPAPMPSEEVVMRAYRVERLAEKDVGELQDLLNALAEEGWRLRQILPLKKELLVVLEGPRPAEWDFEIDDGMSEDAIVGLSGALGGGAGALEAVMQPEAAEGGAFDMAGFTALVAGLNLRYFRPEEFLVLGNQHYSGACMGKNTLPPRNLWRNILPTAQVLDMLREDLGARIRTLSVYRSPAYNACIPGSAGGSVHLKFMAVDFACDDGRGPVHWATRLKALRDAGVFKGGIGVYSTFVHVDTRGYNATWGPLMNRVF